MSEPYEIGTKVKSFSDGNGKIISFEKTSYGYLYHVRYSKIDRYQYKDEFKPTANA